MDTLMVPPHSPLKVRMDFAGGSILVEFSDTATARAFAGSDRVRDFGEMLADGLRRFLADEESRGR